MKKTMIPAMTLMLMTTCCAGSVATRPDGADAVLAAAVPPMPRGGLWDAPVPPVWKEIDKLVEEQKFQAALDRIAELERNAAQSGDAVEQVRILVRKVSYETAWNRWQDALNHLLASESSWPTDIVSQTTLGLYLASTIQGYRAFYGWEIARRPERSDPDLTDVKTWSTRQLNDRAVATLFRLWAWRDTLKGIPASIASEFLENDTFPEGIRGTMADAVAYGLASALADSATWPVRFSGELWKLKPENLTADAARSSLTTIPEDRHPLLVMSDILRDLEAMKAEAGNRPAALEARLELIRLVDGHSGAGKGWHRALTTHLETRLKSENGHDWWAEGMALLAEMTMGLDDRDSFVKALEITRLCRDGRPESNGAARCEDVAGRILARELSDFGARAVDGAGSKAFVLESRNVDHAWFRSWKIDYAALVATPGIRDPESEIVARYRERENLPKPDMTWDSAIDDPKDYKSHKSRISTPISDTGIWVVQISADPGFRKENNVIRTVIVAVGGPIVNVEGFDDENNAIFRVYSGESGDPVPDAVIRIFRMNWSRGKAAKTLLAKGVTDANGESRFSRPTGGDGRFAAYVDAFGLTWPVSLPYYFDDMYRGSPYDHVQGVIMTDRAIYRPGQQLSFKLMAYRDADEGSLPFVPDKSRTMTVELKDTNRETVASTTVTTNKWGTASGTFEIPGGRMLGNWTIQADQLIRNTVRVEEYRIPSFSVDIETPGGLRLNRQAEVKGRADYFFGLPVTGARVAWRVERQPVWPWWWWRSTDTSARVIATGTAETDDGGSFSASFLAEADEPEDGTPAPDYIFNLSVDVTDEAGETHSGRKSFRLGFSTERATASTPTRFFEPSEDVEIDMSRTDINGNPAPGGIKWTLARIVSPERTLLPSQSASDDLVDIMEQYEGGHFSGGYDADRMIREWKDGTGIRDGTVQTDSKGSARLGLGRLDAGLWRVRYSVTDQFGAAYDAWFDFKVVSSESTTPLPMFMAAQKPSSEVGQSVRLAVSSAFPNQYALLQVTSRQGRIDTRHLRLDKGTTIIDYPVTPAMRGGLTFSLLAYHSYESLAVSTTVAVPWSDRRLDVKIATFRDKVVPGGRETVSIKVSDPDSKKGIGTAEVLTWMYDKALDDIARGYFPDLSGIWPGVKLPLPRFHNLGRAREIWFDSEGFDNPQVSFEQYEPLSLKYLERRWGGRYARGNLGLAAPMATSSGFGRGGGGLMKSRTVSLEMADGMAQEADEESSVGMFAAVAPASAPAPDEAAAVKAEEAAQPQPRTNFAETAFFQPHLLTGTDGSVTFQYVVPDSITTWKLIARAQTMDLRTGGTEQLIVSARDMMVKPFLPRFLREGDRSVVTAVVANSTDKPLSGSVTLEITDPATGRNIDDSFKLNSGKVAFTCQPKAETTVKFEIQAPTTPGPAAFKVSAMAGTLSDGELRPVPVLPGRYHLMQSRFATLNGTGGADSRTLEFADMSVPDPGRINEKLVVTVDGQLFMSVLKALPYLVDYPYECAEQTLNRFVSTGIMTALFDRYPGIAAMARRSAERETQYAPWNEKDPNRKLSLEETPWLQESSGEGASAILKILDPKVAEYHRRTSLTRLKKMQQADGAFPWFPGGPPSAWMTMYVISGLSRALEFGVEVPNDIMTGAIRWTRSWYLDMIRRHGSWIKDDWHTANFLSWILWNLPPNLRDIFSADERRNLLELAFTHWKDMSMGMKSMLAMTLHRAERKDDARLVWASVMDGARTEPDRGMFWAQEERSWLWYNDSIENHARAIRTMMELDPEDKSIDDLVLWLLINKKMNHWKSTRATAEVIYALARHMSARGEIGGRQVISVKAGQLERDFTFDPEASADTTAQMVIDGPDMVEESMSRVSVSTKTPGWALASATWHFSTDTLPDKGDGDMLNIERRYFLKKKTASGVMLEPLADGTVVVPGDEVQVQVSIKSGEPLEYVHLRDPRPAGFEPATQNSGYRWDLGIAWYEEVRDSGQNFFFDRLPRGEYTFRYGIRAALAGTYKAGPATIQPMYAPEFAAYSAGRTITIGSR
ncbi:MAG TPA: alpha-2-macroglobulin family protein [Myxococcota bacterium]|nr:alpha-2-macroglobulin family protein [Myxococcota bacterium]